MQPYMRAGFQERAINHFPAASTYRQASTYLNQWAPVRQLLLNALKFCSGHCVHPKQQLQVVQGAVQLSNHSPGEMFQELLSLCISKESMTPAQSPWHCSALSIPGGIAVRCMDQA